MAENNENRVGKFAISYKCGPVHIIDDNITLEKAKKYVREKNQECPGNKLYEIIPNKGGGVEIPL